MFSLPREEAEKKDDAIISTWCNEEWKRNDSVSSWPINITDPFLLFALAEGLFACRV